jgi:hypothetical protein
VEGCFQFFPFDAGIFNPEVGVAMLAPIGHPFRVKELNSKVETAHLGIFLHMPDRITPEIARQICSKTGSKMVISDSIADAENG